MSIKEAEMYSALVQGTLVHIEWPPSRLRSADLLRSAPIGPRPRSELPVVKWMRTRFAFRAPNHEWPAPIGVGRNDVGIVISEHLRKAYAQER